MKVYIAVLRSKSRQTRQQPLLQIGANGGELKRTGVALRPRVIDGVFQLFERLLDTRQQGLAFGRDMYLTSITAKQWPRQIFLERADLYADGARRDAERIGRPCKAQMLGDGHKDAQASQRQPTDARSRYLAGSGALAWWWRALLHNDGPDLLIV